MPWTLIFSIKMTSIYSFFSRIVWHINSPHPYLLSSFCIAVEYAACYNPRVIIRDCVLICAIEILLLTYLLTYKALTTCKPTYLYNTIQCVSFMFRSTDDESSPVLKECSSNISSPSTHNSCSVQVVLPQQVDKSFRESLRRWWRSDEDTGERCQRRCTISYQRRDQRSVLPGQCRLQRATIRRITLRRKSTAGSRRSHAEPCA